MRNLVRWITIATLSLLGGCATQAQTKAIGMKRDLIAAVQHASACVKVINSDPVFAALWVRMPRPPNAPSLDQLMSSAYASPQEIVLFKQHHDEVEPCRDTALTELQNVDERLAVVVADHFNSADSIALDLVQHKITWGQANQRVKDDAVIWRRQIFAAARDIQSDLDQENATEIARRAQIAEAIGQGLSAAAQAVEAAQTARRASLPVVTTCTGFRNMATCVSNQ